MRKSQDFEVFLVLLKLKSEKQNCENTNNSHTWKMDFKNYKNWLYEKNTIKLFPKFLS